MQVRRIRIALRYAARHLDSVVGEHGGKVVVVVASGGSIQVVVRYRVFHLCAV
jgi:broad specificity phosphatase PhoE